MSQTAECTPMLTQQPSPPSPTFDKENCMSESPYNVVAVPSSDDAKAASEFSLNTQCSSTPSRSVTRSPAVNSEQTVVEGSADAPSLATQQQGIDQLNTLMTKVHTDPYGVFAAAVGLQDSFFGRLEAKRIMEQSATVWQQQAAA